MPIRSITTGGYRMETTGDVDWFGKSFNEELSVRLQKLNIKAPVTNTPESIESAFLSYLKACEQRRIKRLEAFTADKPEIVLQSTERCVPLSLLIPKGCRMPVPNATTLRAVRWRN